MKQKTTLFCLFFLISILGADAQKQFTPLPKIAPGILKEDFVLLKKILEANHPSLYWYTPKDSIDACFESAINSITDSLNEVQFKNKVAWVISKIRCGHTSVRFSKSYEKIAGHFRYPQFPLLLKTWGDSLVVVNSFPSKDAVFKRGTIITGINGRTNHQLLDTLFQYITSDGFSFNFKSQVVSGSFPAWYKTILGLDSSYRVSYIDTTGKEAVATIKNFRPTIDTSKKNRATALFPLVKPTRKQIREARLLSRRGIAIDTALNTAFIRLTSFTGGNIRGFFRHSFKTIRQKHIQHLVIDLRENGGGKVSNSILLTQYLTDHPFKVGDSVVAISRRFKYGRYIKPSWTYWLAMNFGAHKMKDGLIHLRYYETHLFQPQKKDHFTGDVYLVQGGYSFSATAMFISYLKGQKNVKLVGEETGGGYYGSSAMHIPTIVLPNTGLRVSLPMYRVVIDSTRPKGHGIIPDIEIDPSSQAIKNGIDLKMQKIRELIQQKTF